MLKVGDGFKINTITCKDEELLSWYYDQEEEVLVAQEVDEDTNTVWAENCDLRINLNEIFIY